MRFRMPAILAAIGMSLAVPAHAAPAMQQKQDGDYQALLRCYGFHMFKIELGQGIEKPDIAESGRQQSELDLGALRVYATKNKIAWPTVEAATKASAQERRALYLADQREAATKAMLDDQDFCQTDAYVDIILKYQ